MNRWIDVHNDLANENTKKALEILEKTLEVHNLIQQANMESAQVVAALASEDKCFKEDVLKEQLTKYKNFINSTTVFTGIYTYEVPSSHYADKSVDYINIRLFIVKVIIILKVLTEHVAEKALESLIHDIFNNHNK